MNKSIKIDSRTFAHLQAGLDLLDLNIVNSADESLKFNLLINNDLLLRVEKKQKSKVKKDLLKSVVESKDLVSPKVTAKLKEACSLNEYINERMGMNMQRAYGSQDGFDDFYTLLTQRWERIQKLEKELKMSLLKKDKVGYCKKCHALRQAGNLSTPGAQTKSRCFICQQVISLSKTYYSLPEATAQYISGFWLEDYVSKKLETLGWITMTNVYVYGASGVKFEIDILATKQGKTLVVECKTGKGRGSIGLNSISSFLAKHHDIRTDTACYISLPKAAGDMRSMVKRRKDFNLIDEVKSDKDLIRQLKKI